MHGKNNELKGLEGGGVLERGKGAHKFFGEVEDKTGEQGSGGGRHSFHASDGGRLKRYLREGNAPIKKISGKFCRFSRQAEGVGRLEGSREKNFGSYYQRGLGAKKGGFANLEKQVQVKRN